MTKVKQKKTSFYISQNILEMTTSLRNVQGGK